MYVIGSYFILPNTLNLYWELTSPSPLPPLGPKWGAFLTFPPPTPQPQDPAPPPPLSPGAPSAPAMGPRRWFPAGSGTPSFWSPPRAGHMRSRRGRWEAAVGERA